MLAAVILAAGESRRMGRPKALLPLPTNEVTPGKITFLEHLISVATQPKIGALRVVLGAHAERIQEAVPIEPSSVVINPDWATGQLSSIQAGVRSLDGVDFEGMMLFLVDHPLISKRLVETLADTFYKTRAAIIVPTYNGKRGHPVVFSAQLFSELLSASPDKGARAVVWAHAAEVVEVTTNERGVVINLNDPQELLRMKG